MTSGAATQDFLWGDLSAPENRDPTAPIHGGVTIGVDPGQRVDPTAIAVVESYGQVFPPFQLVPVFTYEVRLLERMPIGTSYVAVAQRVRQIAHGVLNRTGGLVPQLFIDATGVGTPLVDMLIKAQVEARLTAVYFTHGDRRRIVLDKATQRPFVSLGKAWLVGRLQALLQSRQIHLPDTAEADALVAELLNYELRVSENGSDTYGAFSVGKHDDLVTALGLAVQIDAGPSGGMSAHIDAPTLPEAF